jgi:large repetitive protein
MTRKVTAKAYVPRAVALLFGVFLVLIGVVALAQKLESGQIAESRVTRGRSSVDAVAGAISRASAAMQRKRARNDSGGPPPFPLFLSAVTYDTGGNAAVNYSIAVADLNHDGNLDVVVPGGTPSGEAVAVLLGNGDGTYRTAVSYGSGGVFPALAVADVNGDGKPDILTANEFGSEDLPGTIGVLLGNGDGTFQPVVTYDPGAYEPLSIAVADLNGDGKRDLVVVACSSTPEDECSGGGLVSVLMGNGDGTFKPAVIYSSGGYQVQEARSTAVALVDVNGDGKLDILVANNCAAPCEFGEGEGSVAVLLGNGDGTFQPAVSYDPGFQDSTSLAVGDVNGDGKPDLLVTGFSSPGVGILLGNGDGTFQHAITSNVGGDEAIAVGDVNGDGKLDLLVGWEGLDVLLGDGDGTLQSPVVYNDASGAGAIVVADVNHDGFPDVVTAGEGESEIAVLLHVGDKPSTIALTSSPNPSVYGQVVFTATVGSASGPVPTGVVQLYDGSNFAGSATLASGKASISSDVGVGSNSMTAVYEGSLTYSPSLSGVVNQIVTQATTTTALTSSVNPALINKPVVYTASVTSQYGAGAGGFMTFSDGGSPVKQASMKGNQAVFKTKYSVVGTHTITAAYGGDPNNAGSVSTVLTEDIDDATTTTLATSGSPSHVGQPVTFTATVTSPSGSIPNGELVTFSAASKILCSAPLSAGKAVCTTTFTKAKTYNVKAQYPGDATFRASLGKVVQVVQP